MELTTSRRDQPALSLLPGSDQEWIVWMPEGYYDTSIAGDRRLLGWHVNKIVDRRPVAIDARPSEFYPMSRYEGQLRRPQAIDTLLRTADPLAALRVAQGPRVVVPPPRVRFVEPAAAPGRGD
jgi:hypothetical protein